MKVKKVADIPWLLAQWHPTKNEGLDPRVVAAGTGVKIWWKCSVAEDHEWQATGYRRVNGRGCHCCAGRKVVSSNCMATTHPYIAAEWHLAKNGDLTPHDVVAGSNRQFWWKCPVAEDHEWQATGNHRVGGCGCPCCAGQKVVPSNCMATTHPHLAAEWHPVKNGDLTPHDVRAGSHKKFWWKCPVAEDHEWEAMGGNRTKGHGCPCCAGQKVVPSNCMATTHSDIASQWHHVKNGDLTPHDVMAGSNQRFWWKCPVAEDHEWQAPGNDRLNGYGCPCCAFLKVVPSNCMATTHPQLAAEWHPVKNGNLTPHDVVAKSDRRFWWKCPVAEDHEWQAAGYTRAKGHGCSCCAGQKVVPSNCMATTHPHLAAEWHPVKNGDLTPHDVIAGSRQKFWWKCPVAEDHEWEAAGYHRVNGTGCNFCYESKGERLVADLLDAFGIAYEREASLPGCRYKSTLHFDFKVMLDDGIAMLEYHGQQHYSPVKFSRRTTDEEALNNLKEAQARDKVKERYCASRGIPYLAIPYWDSHRVEYLLEEVLGIKAKGEAA